MLEEIFGETLYPENHVSLNLDKEMEDFNKKYDHFIKYRGNNIKAVCFIAFKIFYKSPYFKNYRKKIVWENGKIIKAPRKEPEIPEVVRFLYLSGFPIEKLFHPNIDWYRCEGLKKQLAKKYKINLPVE